MEKLTEEQTKELDELSHRLVNFDAKGDAVPSLEGRKLYAKLGAYFELARALGHGRTCQPNPEESLFRIAFGLMLVDQQK